MVKKRGHLLDRQMSKFTKQFQHFRPKKVRSSLQQCGVDIDIKIMDFTLEFGIQSVLEIPYCNDICWMCKKRERSVNT